MQVNYMKLVNTITCKSHLLGLHAFNCMLSSKSLFICDFRFDFVTLDFNQDTCKSQLRETINLLAKI